MDVKEKLSLLWIFAMFNYLYADVLSLYEPGVIGELMTGAVEGVHFTPGILLGAAILMESAMVMIVLSRWLEYRWNRLVNILVGVVHTLAVFLSTFVGTPALFYVFFGAIEMATTLLIVWLAWKWKN